LKKKTNSELRHRETANVNENIIQSQGQEQRTTLLMLS